MRHLSDRKVRLLTLEGVEGLLSEYICKTELIRLGTTRFSIPRKELQRLHIEEIKTKIMFVLDNEVALYVAAQKAVIAKKVGGN